VEHEPTDAIPEVHRLATVRYRARGPFGLPAVGAIEVPVRLRLLADGNFEVARADSRPLGDLIERCAEELAAYRAAMTREQEGMRVATGRWREAHPAAPPAEAPAQLGSDRHRREEQTRALARLAEMREQAWREGHQHPGEALQPVDGAPPPGKTTSSVFRVDQQQITDRINRLKRLRTPLPGSPDPPPPTP
jgi:hypothetical protein